MAQDNEQICLLAFNVFSIVCILYCCENIYSVIVEYSKIGNEEDQQACHTYLIWKIVFLLHVIFFFISLSFSVGTAQSYLNEEENPDEENQDPAVRRRRIQFDNMIEHSMDVVRIFCVMFCGPFLMVECILSLALYNKITN